MSLSKLGRPLRRRLPFVVAIVLLTGAIIAVPQVSSAKAAVKQDVATITKVNANTYTETVTNCGDATGAPCTASSTIGLGTVYIAVPSSFVITSVSVSSPTGNNWTVSYNSGSKTIQAFAVTGSDKLQAGQSVNITFSTALNTCPLGTSTFTTSAWGSNTASNTDPFTLQGPQPTVVITDCQGPNTDVTGGGFTGVVTVTFNGSFSPDCSGFPNGAQWSSYHMPDVVNLDGSSSTPSPAGKTFTFAFPATSGVDSSWYLVCYATTTQWTGFQGTQQDGTTTYYVGILSKCYDPATNTVLASTVPCVTTQYETLPTSANPNTIVITVRDPIDSRFN